jgi:hypothetical protein
MFHVERSLRREELHISSAGRIQTPGICTEYFVLHIVVRCIQT